MMLSGIVMTVFYIIPMPPDLISVFDRRARSKYYNSQFPIPNSQFPILHSQFSILNSQFSILHS
ncbi:MAG: hypothetical protein F6K31_17330 [Symploca sp. SIO2G7]|nr:hypothetical protein [Symploca sp. SIO2G7]